jgi:FKBP-type peptidyl-prolyl cis-trans isomerase (trigger factor)
MRIVNNSTYKYVHFTIQEVLNIECEEFRVIFIWGNGITATDVGKDWKYSWKALHANKTYFEEIKDIDLDIVSNPEISLNQIEKGKDFIYKAKVATKPPVELGDLKKIKIEKVDSEVTDEDVEKEIESKLKANSTKQDVTDRAAQEKDEATINFEGFVD